MRDPHPFDLEAGFRLVDWTIRPDNGSVSREEEVRHLRPQPMAVLVVLARHPGAVVARDDIFSAVWGGAAVEPGALPRCVSEIRSVLGDDARDPRFIQTVPKRGYRLLPAPEAPEPAPAPTTPSALHRRQWALVLAAVLALAFGGWWYAAESRSRPAPPVEASRTVSISAGPRVGVLGVSELAPSAQPGWLTTAISALLTSELAVSDRLRTVPDDAVASARRQLSIAPNDRLSAPAMARLRTTLGLDYAVVGELLLGPAAVPRTLRLDVKVYGDGPELVAAIVETGTVEALGDAVLLAGLRIRQALGVGDGLATERRLAGTPAPTDPRAARLYYEGLHRLRRFEAREAVGSLEEATVVDPSSALAFFALAQAWSALGYEVRAAEAAQAAVDRSEGLGGEARLWVEARALGLSGRWDQAIERLEALWLVSPQNLEYGRELAEAHLSAGDLQDASHVARTLRERVGTATDPRVALLVAQTAIRLGDADRAIAESSTAFELASRLDAPSVAAEALWLRGRALARVGRRSEAEESVGSAIERFEAAGQQSSIAGARATLAFWLMARGELVRGEALLRSSLAAAVASGDRMAEALVLGPLAAAVWDRGDRLEAETMFRQAIETYRDIGARSSEAETWIAFARSKSVHTTESVMPMLESALAIFQDLGDRQGMAIAFYRLGRAAYAAGEVDRAVVYLEESLELGADSAYPVARARVMIWLGRARFAASDLSGATEALEGAVETLRESTAHRLRAYTFQVLGQVYRHAGELARSRRALDDSLAARAEAEDRRYLAWTRIELSQTLMAEAQWPAAEEAARLAVSEADAAGGRAMQQVARARLAEVLLNTGRPEAALAVVEGIDGLAAPAAIFDLDSVACRLVVARVLAATGDVAQGRDILQSALEWARAGGAIGLALEARLGLLELARGPAAGPDWQSRRRMLHQEAIDLGQVLLAGRAEALASIPASPKG